jgi:hypothetical protein
MSPTRLKLATRGRIHDQSKHQVVRAQIRVVQTAGNLPCPVEAVRCGSLEARYPVIVEFCRNFLGVTIGLGLGCAWASMAPI